MQSFKDYLNEAESKDWTVQFKKAKVDDVNVKDDEVTVKARSAREAITKAGKKMGLNKDQALRADTENVKAKD